MTAADRQGIIGSMNALRISNVVLVRDAAGYRLVPLGDATGSGNIDAEAARAEPGYGISVVPLQYVSAQTLIKLLGEHYPGSPQQIGKAASQILNFAKAIAKGDTVLACDIDGQSVLARLPGRVDLAAGTAVHLDFGAADLHRFDPATGHRLP